MKQVIVVRKDLDMSPGKIAVQVAHASLKSYKQYLKSMTKDMSGLVCIDFNESKDLVEWQNTGETKIAVWCKDNKEMEKIRMKANELNIRTVFVIDEGRTELDPQTITCMALGPAPDDIMDKVTKRLRLI